MPDREYPAELQRFFYSSCDRSTLLGITKEIQCCSFLPAKKTYISPKALCGPLSARSLKRDWGKVPNLYLFERYIANAMEGHREFMIADDLPLKMSQSGTISTYIAPLLQFSAKGQDMILTPSMEHRKDSHTHLIGAIYTTACRPIPLCALFSRSPPFAYLSISGAIDTVFSLCRKNHNASLNERCFTFAFFLCIRYLSKPSPYAMFRPKFCFQYSKPSS